MFGNHTLTVEGVDANNNTITKSVTFKYYPTLSSTITSCGVIITPGIYSLGSNLGDGTPISGSCIMVLANGVTIDGAGFRMTGDGATTTIAIDARAHDYFDLNTLFNGGYGYGTLTVQNINLMGFGKDITADGIDSTSPNVSGGNGGDIVINNATTTSVSSNGGNASNASGGVGGNITITSSTNLDISHSIISLIGGIGDTAHSYLNGANGTLSLAYAGSVKTVGVIMSALNDFVINGISYGIVTDNNFTPILSPNVESCGTLFIQGTYTLTKDISNSPTCLNIQNDNIIIDGAGYTINGNIKGSGYNFSVINANVTGNLTSNGGAFQYQAPDLNSIIGNFDNTNGGPYSTQVTYTVTPYVLASDGKKVIPISSQSTTVNPPVSDTYDIGSYSDMNGHSYSSDQSYTIYPYTYAGDGSRISAANPTPVTVSPGNTTSYVNDFNNGYAYGSDNGPGGAYLAGQNISYSIYPYQIAPNGDKFVGQPYNTDAYIYGGGTIYSPAYNGSNLLDNGSFADTGGSGYSNRAINYQVYQYYYSDSRSGGLDSNHYRIADATPLGITIDGTGLDSFQSDIVLNYGDSGDGYLVVNTTDGTYTTVDGYWNTNITDTGAWIAGDPFSDGTIYAQGSYNYTYNAVASLYWNNYSNDQAGFIVVNNTNGSYSDVGNNTSLFDHGDGNGSPSSWTLGDPFSDGTIKGYSPYITAGGNFNSQLYWNQAQSAFGYVIYNSTNNTYVDINNSSQTSWYDDGSGGGYSVVSGNPTNDGYISSTQSTNNSNFVSNLNWSDVGADGYIIQSSSNSSGNPSYTVVSGTTTSIVDDGSWTTGNALSSIVTAVSPYYTYTGTGRAQDDGTGGDIYVASSTISGLISANGGHTIAGVNGMAGTVTVASSSVISGNIYAQGGNSLDAGTASGKGGTINIESSSRVPNAYVSGGSSVGSGIGGDAGTINVSNATVTGIISNVAGQVNGTMNGAGGLTTVSASSSINNITNFGSLSIAHSSVTNISNANGTTTISAMSTVSNIANSGGLVIADSPLSAGNISNTNGTVSITGTNMNLSGVNISNTGGTLNVTDLGSLTATGGSLTMNNLLINNYSYGSFSSEPWPLLVGTVTGCGRLSAQNGLYTLGTNLGTSTPISSTCYRVKGSGITFDGANHTITGASSSQSTYAFDATNPTVGGDAYGTTTIQNLTIVGFGQSFVAQGSDNSNGKGGNGGNVLIANSSIRSSVLVDGGDGTTNGGNGGVITLNNTDAKGGIVSGQNVKLVAVTDGGQIYTSADGGSNWASHEGSRNWQSITSSADGTKLVAVVNGGQIYTSTDSGATWTARDSSRTWRSIASSADGNKIVAVAYNGKIYTSTDSGVTWTPRDSVRNWNSITSSADGTKLAAVVSGGQIYISTDSGLTWNPRDSSRNWSAIASSADGTNLVATAYNNYIYTSGDSGVTWTPRDSNRAWGSITSSADGAKLAAVVSNGQIYTSTDSGVTWTARDSSRNWYSITSNSSGTKLAASVYNGQIYTSVDSGVTWTARGPSRRWISVASTADNVDISVPTVLLSANGGNSIACGNGGNAGGVGVIESIYDTISTLVGLGSSATCPSTTVNHGSSGNQVVTGVYVSPAQRAANAAAATAAAASRRSAAGGGGTSGGSFFPGFNTDNIGKLNLANLPSFGLGNVGNLGDNFGVSNLVNPLAGLIHLKPIGTFNPIPSLDWSGKFNNFLNNSLPKSLVDLSKAVPSIKKDLTSANIINGYDLYQMKESPVNVPTLTELNKDKTTVPESLIFVSVDGKERETKLSIDKKGEVYQIINVEPYATLDVSVKSTAKKVPSATFNKQTIKTTKDKKNIVRLSVVAPKGGGSYTLKVGTLTLEVRVIKSQPTTPATGNQNTGTPAPQKKLSPLQKLWSWFSK